MYFQLISAVTIQFLPSDDGENLKGLGVRTYLK